MGAGHYSRRSRDGGSETRGRGREPHFTCRRSAFHGYEKAAEIDVARVGFEQTAVIEIAGVEADQPSTLTVTGFFASGTTRPVVSTAVTS